MNENKIKHLYLKTFLIALGTAILIFLPAIIYDGGYFLYLGDFNSQQVPFYMNAHDSIRNGEWGWNWYTDLGANFIGSYTFYLLGSPFFYLTLPLPSAAVPYMMGPLLALKMAFCALFACMYVRRYVKNEIFAMLGGFLYAFSGYSIYNIFFNHFHDVMVFFPLMLYAMDEWMEKGRRGIFALAVAMNALVNYFFFFGEAVFAVIYYFVRLFSGGYEKSLKKFLGIFLEAVIGFMISMILMLPSALVVIQNSRINKHPNGFGMWLYSSKERIPAIINSFLFPPELPSRQVLLPDANTKWTSLSAYLPVVGCAGVITFMQTKRRHWISYLLRTLLVIALIPGLNSLFVAFNSSYYARWFYMLILIMIVASVMMYEHGNEARMERVTWQVLAVVVVITLALGVTPQYNGDGEMTRLGLYTDEDWPYFLAVTLTSILGLVAFQLMIRGMKEDPRGFGRRVIACVLIFSVLYGNFFVVWGKTRSYDTHNYLIPDCIRGEEKITIPDKDEVIRIDTDDSQINMGMFWKISCMRAFHSVVPATIVDFYTYIGEKRSVNSKIPESQYAVRGLLSVHWYFDKKNMSDSMGTPGEASDLMPGYTYYDTMADYNVWENQYYVPMGFCYDEYIMKEDLDNVLNDYKALQMLHSVALTADQAFRYQDVLKKHQGGEDFYLNRNTYFRECEARRELTVKELARTKKGITCLTDFDETKFVFFSIPYDEGWSCYIDGSETQIEKVNIGFMGICVPGGDHEIEFIYRTPGLKAGALLSVMGLVILGLYCFLGRKFDQKNSRKKAPEDTEDASISISEDTEPIELEFQGDNNETDTVHSDSLL